MGTTQKLETRTGRRDLTMEMVPWASRPDGFDQQWEELFESQASIGPHFSPSYVCYEMERAHNPCLATIQRSGKLVAVLPMDLKSKFGIPIGFVLPKKELGYSGVLVADDDDDDILVEMGRLLSLHCSALIAGQVHPNSRATYSVLNWFVSEGGWQVSKIRAIRHELVIQDRYDEMMARLKSPKSLSTLRRQTRRLHEKYDVQIQCFQSNEIDDTLFDRLYAIQRASWMERRGAAKLENKDLRAFTRDLCEKNLVKCWIMSLDGDDAAMVINYEAHGFIYYKYPAFKLKYQQDKIGNILLSHVIADACERGMATFDFGHGGGFGPTEYKRWWSDKEDTIQRIAAGRTIFGQMIAVMTGLAWGVSRVAFLRRVKHKIKTHVQFKYSGGKS